MTAARRELAAITEALRRVIKSRGMTYAMVAEGLAVSEKTIKRLFGGREDISLERLAAVCLFLGVDFFDLMKSAAEPRVESFDLTDDQERFLLDHAHHLAYFQLLLQEMVPADIAREHRLSEPTTRRYLKELEAQGLIERLEEGRCQVRFKGGLRAKSGGPLAKAWMVEGFSRLMRFLEGLDSVGAPCEALGAGVTGASRMSRANAEACRHELSELINRILARAKLDQSTMVAADLVDVEFALAIGAPFRAFERAEPVELQG